MEGRLLNLKWNSHGAEFVTLLDDFRRKGLYTDATLACEDCIFHVHTVVLSVCSPFFAKIFHNTYCQSPIVVLQDISAKQMEDLLIYMYCGEVRVHKDELPSLLKIAESLQIKGLVSSHPTDTAVVTSATEEQIARWGATHVQGFRSQFKSDVDIRSQIDKGFERQIHPSHYSYPIHYHYRGSTPTNSRVSLDTRERIHPPMSPKSKGPLQSSEEVASSSSPSQERPIDYHFSRSRRSSTNCSTSIGAREGMTFPVSHNSKSSSLQSSAEEVASSSSPKQERPQSLPHVRRDIIPFQERPMSVPSTTTGHPPSAFHSLVSSMDNVKTEPEERGEYMEESSRMLPVRMVTPKPATVFKEDPSSSNSLSLAKSPSKSLESDFSPLKSLLSPGSPLPIRNPHFTVTSPRHQILTLESQYRHSSQLQGEMLRPPAGHSAFHPPMSLEITPHPFFSPSKDPQKHLREPPPLLKMPSDMRHPFIQPGSSHYPVDMREMHDPSQHSSHLLVKSLPIQPYRPLPSTSIPSPTSSFRFHIHNPQMGPISVTEGMTVHDYPQSSSSLPATLPGTMSDLEGPLNLSGQRSPASTTSDRDHANDPFLGKIITNRRKRLRGPKSWEFLVRLLKDPTTNPSLIRWENEANGIFRLVQPAVIAQRWGRRTGKHSSECLTYENFARGLRYHYATGALAPVSELSFVYKFGPKAEKLLKELEIE